MAEALQLDGYDYEQLKEVREQINQRLKELEAKAIATLQAQAITFGFQLIKNGLGLKAKPKARYQNPADPSQIYSGRGRKPAWLQELLDAGREMEEFRA